MPQEKTTLAPGVEISTSGSLRADDYANVLTGLGGAYDKSTYGLFVERPQLGFDQLSSVYEQDAVSARIIDRLVDDATREGFEIKGTDEAFDFASVQSQLEDLDALNAIADAWRWSRLYGGALLLLNVNDGQPMDQPLNLDSASKLSSLQVIESPFATPSGFNPGLGARAFRRPETYEITVPFGSNKVRRVHRSRVIRFDGMRVPPTRMISNNGWGPSVLERVFTETSQLGEVMGYTRSVMHDLSILVFKMEGLRDQLCGTAQEQAEVRAVIEALRMSIDNLHAAAVDTNDDIHEMNRNTSGWRDLVLLFIDALVRATNYPRTVLLGEQPAGLNASADSEIRSYFDWVASQQRMKLTPAITRILDIILAIRSKTETVPGEYTIDYNPLWQPTEKEQAETRFVTAQADQIYILNDVMSPDEVREREISAGAIIPLETPDNGDAET